jgi:hypothetical protein
MPDGLQTKARRGARTLGAVSPDTIEPTKAKILVFGPPSVGKTYTAIRFPGVYYFDHEKGATRNEYRERLKASGAQYFGPDQGALDFETVIGEVQTLATIEHPFNTIVFDSATKLFNTAIADEQDRLGDKDAFGASKKGPVRQLSRLLRWVNRADMNAIFICHQKDEWGKDDKGNREVIGQTFDCYEKLAYELDLVLRISQIGVGENARRFMHVGKSRLTEFPSGSRFDWSYEEFAERYGRTAIEKAAKPIVLATEDQVAEVRRLLEIVKVPEDWTDKCFKKANVEDWAEMESENIAKAIDFLRVKVSPGAAQ